MVTEGIKNNNTVIIIIIITRTRTTLPVTILVAKMATRRHLGKYSDSTSNSMVTQSRWRTSVSFVRLPRTFWSTWVVECVLFCWCEKWVISISICDTFVYDDPDQQSSTVNFNSQFLNVWHISCTTWGKIIIIIYSNPQSTHKAATRNKYGIILIYDFS